MMKKVSVVVLITVLALLNGLCQEKEKSLISAGINIGMDYNNNAYLMITDSHGFTYYSMNPNLSFGLNLGYFVTKRFRPRFEMEYFYLKYGMNWNLGEDSDFDQTRTTVHYLDLNLHLDYALILGKSIDLFISPGLISDLARGRQYMNLMKDEDDDNEYEYNVLSENYPKAIMGASLSLPFRIKVNDYVRLSLEPEYTYFFHKFMKENSSPYSRMSFKVGLEYDF